MHTLIDLTNQLNDYLQIGNFADFTPNGLQVEGKPEVQRAVTAVTASLNIIEQAIARKADVLLVHHGLFWQRDPQVVVGVKKEKLALLLKNGISLLSYHLPLDAHRDIGNNWKAANDLGWQDLAPFGKSGTSYIGVKGRVKKQSRETFQKKLEAYYGQKAVVAFGGKKQIETCALISGGAYKQIEDASNEGIDCYITGNFDEPAWHLAHEGKVNFFALGHAATEKVGPKALAEHLRSVYRLKADFIDERNPF